MERSTSLIDNGVQYQDQTVAELLDHDIKSRCTIYHRKSKIKTFMI